MSGTIRIRTTPLDSDKYIKLQVSQNFDFLEILSLKIGQDQAYKRFCSDYGVIAGRVIVNGGVGVPNAKLSVFIPISEVDLQDPTIRTIYPFETIGDRDQNNMRYNLLSETPRQDDLCHKAIGTFPQKRRVLDCNPWCEVFGKYYKFTTSTNASGDYMIFGVPVGVQIVHMDVDLSDIGYLSQKPYDMVGSGSPPEVFDHLNEFKSSENIDELVQIKTQNQTINVQPFWGDLDECVVGINRVDFDLNYKIVPTAFFIGSIWGDSEKNSINKNCQVRRHLGYMDQMITGPGTIEMIRRTPENGVESFSIKGNQLIDSDGTWVVQLPMNLENVITDEFGNLVPSGNPDTGLPTKAKYRFRIGMNDYGKGLGRYRSRAHYLVPNWGDYSFDDSTAEFNYIGKPNYANLEWNGVYTVKEFISRYSNTSGDNKLNFVGIKQVQDNTANNPFPFNKFDKDFNPLFLIICTLFTVAIIPLMFGINILINVLNAIIDILNNVPFVNIDYIECFKMDCANNVNSFCPGCAQFAPADSNCNNDPADLSSCMTSVLAESLNVYSFYFSNDWIVGGLYAFLFKFKQKSNKDKFCDVDYDRSNAGLFGNEDLYIRDYDCAPNYQTVHQLHRGVIKKSDDVLYYASNDPVYPSLWLFPTDIYNLGSMKSCDFLGKPKLITALPSTTFNIPTTIDVHDGNVLIERGIDSLLLGVDCFSIGANSDQCTNIYRFCEYGVDYDTDNDDSIIDDSDVEDQPALIRSELECLNVPSICTDCSNLPTGKFDADWMSYRTGDMFGADTYYMENSRVSTLQRSGLKNSFYFYFGLLPGKTSIDKIKSQYFAECERFEPCPIVISGSVANNHCIGSSNGSITLYPIGGTPPYKYDWYYSYPNSPTPWLNWPNDTLSGLSAGNYFVVVKDNVGQKCKKSFTVYDPTTFEVEVDYSKFICTPVSGTSQGHISILPNGGNPPYSIQWLQPPYGSSILPNSGATFYLTGLFPTSVCNHTEIGIGGTGVTSSFYNCIVKDSGDIFGCQSISALTIDITQSCGFTLTSSTVNDYCPTAHKASISIGVINGGVAPFTFVLQSDHYYKSAHTASSFYKFTNLTGSTCPGTTYSATVIDACGIIEQKIINGVVNTPLRYIDYLQYDGQCGGTNYSFYIHLFAGGSSSYIYTDACPAPPYWHAFPGTFSYGYTNPADHWYELPPLNGNPSSQLYFADCGGNNCSITRTPYNSTLDILVFNSWMSQSHGITSFYLCKSETFSAHAVFSNPGDASASKGQFTIKSQSCGDKQTLKFS
jgi:hypothetical protein